MRSICPLSVPSSGEYVYVTAEPISLPYSRLLHPPDISLCPSTLLPPILFPLCVLSLCLFVPSYLLTPPPPPIALWLYQVWSQRPVRLAQRHCLSLDTHTHTHTLCLLEISMSGSWAGTGLPVEYQYRYRYYSRVKRASLIYSGIIFDDGGRRRGKVCYISVFIGISFFLVTFFSRYWIGFFFGMLRGRICGDEMEIRNLIEKL